jgi:alpha-galactosidase
VWVEPERVDLATVGRPGQARERFLAHDHGQYQPGRDNAAASHGQICLADDEAWTWLRDRMFSFLDEARPDYLKIDLNGWLVCTRPDHGHPVDGGNFAHVKGLYRLLDALRERYPQLTIENCAGGARRLDAELLTRTDVNWMDDRTAPAARVRHHLQILSAVVPPSALLSYLIGTDDESIPATRDLALLARSRMPGVLGLTVDFRTLDSGVTAGLTRQLDAFKQVRALRGAAFAAALTAPVEVNGGGPGWDVVEQVNPASGVATVFAFRNPSSDRRVRVVLTQLRPATTYRIRSLDDGPLGTASSDELMERGYDIDASSASAAQVLVFEPQ